MQVVTASTNQYKVHRMQWPFFLAPDPLKPKEAGKKRRKICRLHPGSNTGKEFISPSPNPSQIRICLPEQWPRKYQKCYENKKGKEQHSRSDTGAKVNSIPKWSNVWSRSLLGWILLFHPKKESQKQSPLRKEWHISVTKGCTLKDPRGRVTNRIVLCNWNYFCAIYHSVVDWTG